MSDDLMKQLRWLGDHASFEPHMHHTAADRIEKLEAALLNIVATFGYGSSGGAYKARYFRCLEIAKTELKYLGLGGTYPAYVKYRDKLQELEEKDD